MTDPLRKELWFRREHKISEKAYMHNTEHILVRYMCAYNLNFDKCWTLQDASTLNIFSTESMHTQNLP